ASLPAAANLRNPVDVIGDARADRYTAALEAVLDDSNVDQALVILTPQSMTDIDSIARGICRIHEKAAKPIACSFMGAADVHSGVHLLQQAHIPHYILPEWACDAMANVQRIRQWRRQPIEQPEPLPVDQAAARAIIDQATGGYVDEDRALAVLSAYGLPVPPHKLCATADEAVAFAREIGYPVVLRVVSPLVIHKTEVKGVALNLANAYAVRRAFKRIHRHLDAVLQGAEIRGVLVRGMIPAGRELILGAKRDPTFGPTLMFGLGGIHVELFEDVTFGLAPIDRATAARMMRQVKAYRLLEGVRGAAPADVGEIQQCLVRLGQLVCDFDRISELDVNPLIVGPAEVGNAVADVRIRLAE
ncbi:MAG: acetate--CoA ligase family protein, partial [Planctomycetota bacterium]